jgi:hypothetical protein
MILNLFHVVNIWFSTFFFFTIHCCLYTRFCFSLYIGAVECKVPLKMSFFFLYTLRTRSVAPFSSGFLLISPSVGIPSNAHFLFCKNPVDVLFFLVLTSRAKKAGKSAEFFTLDFFPVN